MDAEGEGDGHAGGRVLGGGTACEGSGSREHVGFGGLKGGQSTGSGAAGRRWYATKSGRSRKPRGSGTEFGLLSSVRWKLSKGLNKGVTPSDWLLKDYYGCSMESRLGGVKGP